jgi:hypothetical protein
MPRPDVVWLASFPKSGNTWFRLLLSNWKSGLDRPVDLNRELGWGSRFKTRAAFDEATLLESGMLTHDEVDLLCPAVYAELAASGAGNETLYVKTHEAYVEYAARAAIYILRDPRDVAVSFAHHCGADLDDTIAILNAPDSALAGSARRQSPQLRQRLLGWSGHVRSWLTQRDVPVHAIRYEDLKADPLAVFRGALDFLGESFDEEEIERAVRFSDFKALRRQERENGFRERMSPKAPFFRQGEAGAWRRALTDVQARRVEGAHAETMARFGYFA